MATARTADPDRYSDTSSESYIWIPPPAHRESDMDDRAESIFLSLYFHMQRKAQTDDKAWQTRAQEIINVLRERFTVLSKERFELWDQLQAYHNDLFAFQHSASYGCDACMCTLCATHDKERADREEVDRRESAEWDRAEAKAKREEPRTPSPVPVLSSDFDGECAATPVARAVRPASSARECPSSMAKQGQPQPGLDTIQEASSSASFEDEAALPEPLSSSTPIASLQHKLSILKVDEPSPAYVKSTSNVAKTASGSDSSMRQSEPEKKASAPLCAGGTQPLSKTHDVQPATSPKPYWKRYDFSQPVDKLPWELPLDDELKIKLSTPILEKKSKTPPKKVGERTHWSTPIKYKANASSNRVSEKTGLPLTPNGTHFDFREPEGKLPWELIEKEPEVAPVLAAVCDIKGAPSLPKQSDLQKASVSIPQRPDIDDKNYKYPWNRDDWQSDSTIEIPSILKDIDIRASSVKGDTKAAAVSKPTPGKVECKNNGKYPRNRDGWQSDSTIEIPSILKDIDIRVPSVKGNTNAASVSKPASGKVESDKDDEFSWQRAGWQSEMTCMPHSAAEGKDKGKSKAVQAPPMMGDILTASVLKSATKQTVYRADLNKSALPKQPFALAAEQAKSTTLPRSILKKTAEALATMAMSTDARLAVHNTRMNAMTTSRVVTSAMPDASKSAPRRMLGSCPASRPNMPQRLIQQTPKSPESSFKTGVKRSGSVLGPPMRVQANNTPKYAKTSTTSTRTRQ